MTSLLVCASVSHGNTRRVAEEMAGVLNAAIVRPGEIRPTDLAGHDLVGFGSGIYNMAFHPHLRELVQSVPGGQSGRAFVFSTSGLPEPGFRRYTRRFELSLQQKGYDTVGSFSCRAFDTWWPFKAFGGIRKGRPNADDLQAARDFAKNLRLTD
ncbi:flavodoxin [Williamsia sp. 1138]|uniref:Flavodoxin family protein n=1 Tax=Gordonia rubripertincta TaxID=36822 RepID=A0ABT4MXK9_GORRU|nr:MULTISPECIES: flavodoxin family protein [Mycobacteriales]MCZ4550751.1 flavodoxin family protein [Gordonia rubripertincta]OZG30544.1 flavodoxin [Williamsia sp. 1138]